MKAVAALIFLSLLTACNDASYIDPKEPVNLVTGIFGTSERLWVEDEGGSFLYWIDTGSPRTQLEPRAIGLPIDTYQELLIQPEILDLGGYNDGTTPVVVVRSIFGFDESPKFGGLIGMDLLAKTKWTHDPRTQQLLFGEPTSVTTDAVASRTVTVEMVGSGKLCFKENSCAEYGENRAIARVQIDGVKVLALVDTGANRSVITPELAELFPGAPKVEIQEANGTVTRRIRISEMGLEGVTAYDVALEIREFSAPLARLQIETGLKIEAFLGMDFFNRFATTFDFSYRQVELHAFADLLHYSEPDRRGFSFMVAEDTDACFRVNRLVLGGDAEQQGLRLGDCVAELNGVLPGDGQLELFLETLGPTVLGDTFTLEVLNEASGEMRTITVAIQELLGHLTEPGVLIE